jgi:predicted DNA-binding transcriptional regulator AlpA
MAQRADIAVASDDIGTPLLRIEAAARYVGVSRSTFVADVMPRVAQVRVTPHRVSFRKEDLDSFIAAQVRAPDSAGEEVTH